MTRFDWWNATDREVHETLVSAAEWIDKRDAARKESYVRGMRLYGGSFITDYADNRFDGLHERLGLNVIKAAVQAVVATLIRSLPTSRVLTTGGNWSLKRKARLLENFLEGQRQANDIRELAGEVALDFALVGTGVVKVYPDFENKKIGIDHVHPGELFVDHVEAIYRRPKVIYQRKYVNKEVLKGLWPDHADKIELEDPIKHPSSGSDTTAELVEVWEGWHLPSHKDAKDGRHVIAIKSCCLLDESWKHDCFPFVICRWDMLPYNFWGEGLADQLVGIQVEINRVLQKIQKAIHLLAVPRVFVEAGSKVQKAHINNAVGAIVTYTGTKPIVETPQTTHPEVFKYLWDLYAKAFEISGLTQLGIAGATPAGLTSGEAIREWSDSQSGRFARVYADWEDFWVKVDQAIIRAGEELGKVHKDFATNSPRDKWTTATIRWSEVSMEQDQYVLRCYPASALPSQPSGKLAFINDMINMGLIGPDEGKRLLDFPDLESHMALDRAAMEAVEAAVEYMLDEGVYIPPEPFMDLALALKTCQSAYLRAVVEKAPEERLALLRAFMVDCKRLIDEASMAQQAAAGPLMQQQPGTTPPTPDATGAIPTAPTGSEPVI